MSQVKNKQLAKAWLATIDEKNQGQLLKLAKSLVGRLAELPELQEILSSSMIPKIKKDKVLAAAGVKGQLEIYNLVYFLSKNGRLKNFSEIIDLAEAQYNENNNLGGAVVESAVELSAKQLAQIERILSKKTGRQYQAINRLNREILGGLIIQLEDSQLDFSLLNKLRGLQSQINQ